MANPLTGNSVFLDSAYAIALAVSADQHHQAARTLAAEVLRSRIRILTTRQVMFEVANALSRPRHRPAAVTILQAFESDPLIQIIDLTPELYRAAFELLQQRMDVVHHHAAARTHRGAYFGRTL